MHFTGKNKEELSPARVLEVKEAFIAALERGRVSKESINQIRAELGIPEEMDATGDKAQIKELLTTRFTPLSRQKVRELLDTYAAGGRGFFDNFTAVRDAVGVDGLAIYNDARGVVTNELHVKVGLFDGELVIDTIRADAKQEGGDKSYKIDIGV